MSHEERQKAVQAARTNLRATLGHWKGGTRPGVDPITEWDVMHAVTELVDAIIYLRFPPEAP